MAKNFRENLIFDTTGLKHVDLKNLDKSHYFFQGFLSSLRQMLEVDCSELEDKGKSSIEIYNTLLKKYGDISPMVEIILYEILDIDEFVDEDPDLESDTYECYFKNFSVGRYEGIRVIIAKEIEKHNKGKKWDPSKLRKDLLKKYGNIPIMEDLLDRFLDSLLMTDMDFNCILE